MSVQVLRKFDPSQTSPLHAKHFKGDVYEVLGTGTRESDGTTEVIYRSQDGKIWIRPAYEFFGAVEVNGEWVKRFTLLIPGEGADQAIDLLTIDKPETMDKLTNDPTNGVSS